MHPTRAFDQGRQYRQKNQKQLSFGSRDFRHRFFLLLRSHSYSCYLVEAVYCIQSFNPVSSSYLQCFSRGPCICKVCGSYSASIWTLFGLAFAELKNRFSVRFGTTMIALPPVFWNELVTASAKKWKESEGVGDHGAPSIPPIWLSIFV